MEKVCGRWCTRGTGVKSNFTLMEFQCVRQEKWRTCVPYFHDVSIQCENWARKAARGSISRFPGIKVVAVVSNDITLARKKIRLNSGIKRRHEKLSESLWSNTSFWSNARGLLWKNEKIKKVKIVMTWAYDQIQIFVHSLGGYSHRERYSRTREIIKLRQRKRI